MKLVLSIILLSFSSLCFAVVEDIPSELVCGTLYDNNSSGRAVSISCVSKASIKKDELEVKKLELEINSIEAKKSKPNKK